MHVKMIASDLKNYLTDSAPFEARVHSIFKDVINLIDHQGELITLISENKMMAPMTLQAPFNRSVVKKMVSDDIVMVTDSKISFKRLNWQLEFMAADVWQADFETDALKYDPHTFMACSEIIREALLYKGDNGGLLPLIKVLEKQLQVEPSHMSLPKNNTYTEFIEEVFITLIKHLKNKEYEMLVDILPRFVGFGPGLTPSSDDFLMGMMITLYLESIINNQDQPRIQEMTAQIYNSCISKTTTVSEAMLKNASKGRIASAHRNLIETIYSDSGDHVREKAIAVINNGASSGTDFLFGIYCAQRILLSRAFNR